jgi:tRNA nucleotidyltransferase (CCA-adding enzyme)
MFIIPKPAEKALSILYNNGYEAYIVGGCVRDSIMGKKPNDWDITTSALPDEAENLFAAYRIIKTGLKHGTVTALIDGMPIEITTYRIDGEYSDHRRPDRVKYTKKIKEDLCRRDFTVNALAYSPNVGIIDYFGGIDDINSKTIRCVGEPDKRFSEDALRILRAIRFSSVLGFSIDKCTSDSMHNNKELLKYISAERISIELKSLLCGQNVLEVLKKYSDIIGQIIPEILPMIGFNQNNPYHVYDVWEHTAIAVSCIEPDPVLRLTMLLHDIGKPICYFIDKKGIGHFYGHPQKSEELANAVLTRLRFDNNTKLQICTLVKNHDIKIEFDKKAIIRLLCDFGEKTIRQLLKVKRADCKAQNPNLIYRLKDIDKLESMVDEIIKEGQCFRIKDLAVNGNDLINDGIKEGIEVGKILKFLLDAVINGRCENKRESLMQHIKLYENK